MKTADSNDSKKISGGNINFLCWIKSFRFISFELILIFMKFWQYYCIIGDLAVSKVSKEPAFVQKHLLITQSMAVSFIIIIQHIIFINL